MAISGALAGTATAHASASTRTTQQDQDQEIPVAVVRTPAQNGGTPDSLVQIAARNLGDAGRAQDIFDLNEGRRQADGGVLTDATLRPGWILVLPEDAQGPDVQIARLAQPAQPQADDGNDSAASQGEGADDANGGNAFTARLRWPIVLAVLGGLAVAALTTAIVMRKRIRLNLGRLRATFGTLRTMLIARRKRRMLLGVRRRLIAAWSYDIWAPTTAQKALADHQALPIPVAVSVMEARTIVYGRPPSALIEHKRADSAPHEPRAPAPLTPVTGTPIRPLVRIGGNQSEQVFVDLAQCRGTLNIDGDPVLAQDLASSLLLQLRQTLPNLIVLSLGPSPIPQSASVTAADDLQRFGLLPPNQQKPVGLVNALAPAGELAGVLLVQPGRPPGELEDARARCASPNSGWLLLYPGHMDGAHWRWTVRKDGQLVVPMLDRIITATGTGPVDTPLRGAPVQVPDSPRQPGYPAVPGVFNISNVPGSQQSS